MTIRIALLRAINVAGHGRLAMADLRVVFDALGYRDVRTIAQTGNVLFSAGDEAGDDLEPALEQAVRDRLGLSTAIMVRTGEEWRKIVDANPFADMATRDPGHLVAMVLKMAPGAEMADRLRGAITGDEIVALAGCELYIVYPHGIGRSKLTNALIERHLATRATGRNWNTVLKIAEALQGR